MKIKKMREEARETVSGATAAAAAGASGYVPVDRIDEEDDDDAVSTGVAEDLGAAGPSVGSTTPARGEGETDRLI